MYWTETKNVRMVKNQRVFGRAGVIFITSFFCFSTLLQAQIQRAGKGQKIQLIMKGLAPDWNNILVCDNGKGYTPSPINAPSLSYTGVPDEESKYDYEWQMKSGNGEWKSFQSAKGVEFIPSGRVPVLTNAAGSTELTYSFRLKVDDKTYHLQAETEEYTIRIASAPAPYYDIVNNANGILIDLQVKGGGGVKKFAWASADGRNNIPSSQSKVEDPSGLKPGSYKVTISDAVCNPIVHLINTDEKNRKHP